MIKSFFYTLFLGFFFAFLGSCSQVEEIELNELQGDLVVLTVNIDGIEEKHPDSSTTKSAAVNTLIGVSDLGNGLVLESRLTADVSLATRSVEERNNLAEDAKILALVYRLDGTPYKYQYFSANNARILLTAGESFKIVFYSYNNTTEPALVLSTGTQTADDNGGFYLSDDATFEDNIEANGKNVLFARIEDTGKITRETKLPNVLLSPLFTRIYWELHTDGDTEFSVGDTHVSGAYSDANVYMEKLSAWSVQELWVGNGRPNLPVVLNFNERTGTSLTSEKHIFIPNESNPTTLSSILTMENETKLFTYSLGQLQRGLSYKVVSRVVSPSSYHVTIEAAFGGSVSLAGKQYGVHGTEFESIATADSESNYAFVGWYDAETNKKVPSTTRAAIVSENKLKVMLTDETHQKTFVAKFVTGAPRIYVEGSGESARLEFTHDVTNYGSYFQFGSVLAWSSSGAPTVEWNPTNVVSPTWNSSWTLGLNFPEHSIENLLVGKGDPCRLVGFTQGEVKNMLESGELPDNGQWRLPNRQENINFQYSGNSGYIEFGGIKGYCFGTNASTGGDFVPVSGYREPTGGIKYQGRTGLYWSSTPTTSFQASTFYFDDYLVASSTAHEQSHGLAVRCVRQ